MNSRQKRLLHLEIIMPGIRESDRGLIQKYFEDGDYIGLGDAMMNALDKVLIRDSHKREDDK
jgi:hypothetical protein